MLVVDASVAIRICSRGTDFSILGDDQLVAPALMWSEFSANVHAAAWRGEVPSEQARLVLARLGHGGVRRREHRQLLSTAWEIADAFGWAKTYDAEYCALASLLGCRLVTLDGRLRRGADRLGYVVTPAEL